MGLFRIIAILLLFYFGIKFLGRFFKPFMNKANGNAGNGNARGRRTANSDNRSEGEVRIEYTDSAKGQQKRKGHVEGEYVEFEELD